MKRILGCAVIMLFLVVIPLSAKGSDKNKYDKGETLFKNKCQFCHGVRGDGKGPATEPLMGHSVNFTNPRFWQGDVENKIADTIKNGYGMMPAFDLEPDEIQAIIQYMSHAFKKTPQTNN